MHHLTRRVQRALNRSLLAVSLGLAGVVANPASANDLLIENVTVVSPERAAPVAGQWVHIRDGRIAAIADKPISVPADTPRLDGEGRYLTPGLMDSHVHLSLPAGLPFGVKSPGLDRLAADYHRQQPRSYLYHGVTQVLDPAGFADGIAAYNAQPLKPDLFRCGAASVLNGYPRFVIGDKVHSIIPEFIHEPENPDPIPVGVDPAQHTPEAVVERIAASGARCVKIFIEDGFGDAHNIPLLKPKTMARVRAAAHKAGLLVVGHANAFDMQQIAVDAQVDVIAHGLWNWSQHHGEPGIPADIDALLNRVKAQGIGYQPTLRVMGGIRELFYPDTLSDPQLDKVVPTSLMAFYRSDDGKFFERELRSEFFGNDDNRIRSIQKTVYEQGARVTKALHDKGHPLLLASDTPSAPVYSNQPGLNTYQELRAMAEAGVSLDAVLRAGTINNAKQFGLQKDYGTIEVGKHANLLLLDANPLQHVEAWNAINTVVFHGEAIARDTLAADFKPVAVSDIRIAPSKDRAGFTARLWYPTTDTKLQTFGVSRIRAGYQAVANGTYAAAASDKAQPAKALHTKAPLIVLSHGSGGSADAMAWIGQHLAGQGAIVVAINHPASTGGNAERASILELWQQPLDVSQLLDQLLDGKQQPEWAPRIDATRISHIGFSLGGSTALMLAGAQFELQQFGSFCEQQLATTNTMDGACNAFSHYLAQFDGEHYQRSNGNYRDQRINAVISIAPGFTETLTAAGVKKLTTPVLLLAAANDQQLPPATHIAPVRQLLPKSVSYLEIAEAQHFSLLPLCKPGAVLLLAESKEEFVCQESGAKTRNHIHGEVLASIDAFLKQQYVL